MLLLLLNSVYADRDDLCCRDDDLVTLPVVLPESVEHAGLIFHRPA